MSSLIIVLVLGVLIGFIACLLAHHRAKKKPKGRTAKILKALSSGGGGGPDP